MNTAANSDELEIAQLVTCGLCALTADDRWPRHLLGPAPPADMAEDWTVTFITRYLAGHGLPSNSGRKRRREASRQ